MRIVEFNGLEGRELWAVGLWGLAGKYINDNNVY